MKRQSYQSARKQVNMETALYRMMEIQTYASAFVWEQRYEHIHIQ